jgi:predicted GNAT family N-acyltransferase
LFVKKSTLEYHASAQFDEMITVYLRCDRMGRSSMTFVGAITRDNDLLVEGEIVYVFADPIKKTSLPIPESFKGLINHFEQGQEITKLHIGQWQDLKAQALDLRHLVFVQEQGVPIELEEDEYDETGLHAVLCNELGLSIATARLIQKDPLAEPKTRRIGRMAVRKELRGSGLGSKILSALIERAREMGTNRVSLHAQLSAKSFYEANGFTPVGGVFSEAGIDHIEMIKDIG